MSVKITTKIPEPLKKSGEFDYQAFVYQWLCVQRQKFYIGYHTGFVGDGYTESSKNKEFSDDRHNTKYDWEYSVLDFGTTDEMKNKERDILKWHEARRNPDSFYNQTNGGSAYPHLSNVKLDDLLKSIRDGKYLQPDTLSRDGVDWHTIINDRSQCRVVDNIVGVNYIKDWIDSVGHSNDTNPITLLKDFYGVGGHRLIDGSTTILGMLSSKKGKSLKYNLIPPEDYNGLTESDFEILGASLNPNTKHRKWPTAGDDWAHIFARAFINENRPIKSKENRDILSSCNYAPTYIPRIFSKAKTLISTGAVSKTNDNWKTYKDPITLKELDDRITAINKSYDGKIHVFSFSSDMVKWDIVWQWMSDNKRKTPGKQIRRVMMLIHHPKPESAQRWDKVSKKTRVSLGGVITEQFTARCQDYNLISMGVEQMIRF